MNGSTVMWSQAFPPGNQKRFLQWRLVARISIRAAQGKSRQTYPWPKWHPEIQSAARCYTRRTEP